MKLLIIEDNDIKFEIISKFFAELMPDNSLFRAASYQSGLTSLVKNRFDWVVLDMTLPVSDLELSPVGMDFLAFGGEYLLRECARRRIQTKIIVVTQYGTFVRENEEVTFEQLSSEILLSYPSLVRGCIRLDRGTDTWKGEIAKLTAL